MTPATTTPAHEPPSDPPAGISDGQTGPVVVLPAAAARATIDTLLQLEAFFRHHASDTVHAEFRAFCAGLGWHPVCGAETLLDRLGLHTLPLRHALDTTSTDLDAGPEQR